jgi:hypothetical protein
MSKKRRPVEMPRYLRKLLAQVRHVQLVPGVHVANVYHDDDCDLLAGRGPCNCNAEIRLPSLPGRN